MKKTLTVGATYRPNRRAWLWIGSAAFGLTVSAALLAAAGSAPDVFPLTTPHPVQPVSGRVLCGGQPAHGATVYLYPLDDRRAERWPNGYPRARVGPDGTFAIATDRPGDGAPVGRYAVLVRWPRGPALATNDEDRRADRFNGRFLDPSRPVRAIDIGPNGHADVRVDVPG
ncbi:Uncharacterized protein OS=Pirellula staleyi (strain ATCC 27377 / DSM 6068 / ICPB 4128) GN=Psta_4133 PE=4 SV=1 [Gemmata massiliana]|uniref:Uncharacterized protein n=1 Tax=Gemmata massiliana TaxID=1210884 RepID=A0A6P2DM06_9BACT|nr:DUF4198 domain-containing protein [Gemmata massiliana]VTS02846.1 Uncharacterized protein OS=Pirellula staleyi (strain ATCC 27377 / DSM 6068 / ICPB 4128) GN=Psta_4133 PE=4 SV=1 [Gemmata massiliana]